MHTTIKDPTKLKMQLLITIPKNDFVEQLFYLKDKIHSEIKALLNQDQTF
jgi:hypothetical protein